MRKLTLVLISSFFMHMAFAQAYLEPLEKLNKYLQTGKSFFVKNIEIKDGYLYIYNSYSDDYKKINLEKLGAAKVDKATSSVILKCVNNANCVYNSSIKSKMFLLDFFDRDESVRKELTTLLNDFLISYDKELGITYVPPPGDMGCISGDCINGTGQFIYTDSSSYYGNWKDGKREGGGSLTKKDKTRIYCDWVNNESVGTGEIYYPNGDRYAGAIKNNLPNGEGTVFFKNDNYKNKKTLKGVFTDGKINGKGEYYNLISDTKFTLEEETYSGNFKDGRYDGFGIYKLTAHHRKALKKGMDDTIRYEGSWKNGNREGTGTYLNNHVYEAEEYTGEWKNGLKNGMGICQYRTYDNDLKVGKMKDYNKFEGIWLDGKEFDGKLTTNTGIVLYDGGKKERDAYWQDVSDQLTKSQAAFDKDYEKRRKEREDLAERNAKNANKECVCGKCGGSGKISSRSLKTTNDKKFDATGHEIKSTTTTGWVYEDQLCGRCLGTGKCK